MSMFALRIPQDLKKEMQRFRINWSDYLRHSIQEAVESDRKRHLFEKLREISQGRKPFKKGTAVKLIHQFRRRG